jgi:ubiquinone/menaquinone biosynthesis C-methylase UbiE
LGIDVSERMLERARSSTQDPGITYAKADMERLELPDGAFDLAYSSLALHYVADLAGLIGTVHRALARNGYLVFSVEHPIYIAPSTPAWIRNAAGAQVWPVDGYLNEGPRSTDWLAKGVIKQHRTIATYLNLLPRTGFALTYVEEWGPSEQQISARPELGDERQRPPFLLVAARRT